ncbi:MAG TPA: GspH/FimT family pseudopilin [Longimicrobiaceae bacterium]|nr:GspH/FimT family pseudopilin [Longimicrobiaceae bacterium]
MPSLHDRRGFTLVELLSVLVLVGIIASMAAPRFEGALARMRTRAALDRFTGDLYLARVTAVRTGRTVVVRFPGAARCSAGGPGRYGTDHYVVVVRDTPERVVKRVVVGEGGLCLEMNQSDSLRFDARGLLRGAGNRTVVARRGADLRDSLTVSRAGRVLRRY